MQQQAFKIHGDNIVECVRAFDYVAQGLGDLVKDIEGPSESVSCPVYRLIGDGFDYRFQFLPGFGEHRWNQDILAFVKYAGGRLREAADAIITRQSDEDGEIPIAAIEFCGALPAGNQAWQRQGRAFSFAHAQIPYFFVTELGGFELTSDRGRKAERMPNPAVPFSFVSMTQYKGSVCLPVYEANSGARPETYETYGPIFGQDEFLEFLKLAVTGVDPTSAAEGLEEKCVQLVSLLADSKKRQDGLTSDQWRAARQAMDDGQSLPDYLSEQARLDWKKTTSIKTVTESAKEFMEMGSAYSIGLTSQVLPLSLVPADQRPDFAESMGAIYGDLDDSFRDWVGSSDQHLSIAWINGFKPRGDDARPDRGLPPLARMLVGDTTDLLCFVFGPAPVSHWQALANDPLGLALSNGLWEAILELSDGVLADSSTKPDDTPRGYVRDQWSPAASDETLTLAVEPSVQSIGEQDVDTALHVAFEALGADVAFEGMCNPPGGDWSGISFRWEKDAEEHRWLTLPRVSAEGAKRPDHVFALFGHNEQTICLCIESKERAQSLEKNIGPRLTLYAQALFETAPSIRREAADGAWSIFEDEWTVQPNVYLSAGAYHGTADDPFAGLPPETNLDLQIGVVFHEHGARCDLHLRGDTEDGKALAEYLKSLDQWGDFVDVILVNS
ncbi:MAG: hypothetical protein ACTS1Z_12060 [Parasphingopyxis sp.]|uniref:hypothetical protein n=1 Tax=Parasphingopyxis sp. TaxID=1920299 RepID=UPI003FA0F19D